MPGAAVPGALQGGFELDTSDDTQDLVVRKHRQQRRQSEQHQQQGEQKSPRPPRAQSLPLEPTPGAFGADGGGASSRKGGGGGGSLASDAGGRHMHSLGEPEDSLDDFKGQFLEQLSRAKLPPRARAAAASSSPCGGGGGGVQLQAPKTSNQNFGWDIELHMRSGSGAIKQLARPASFSERLTERNAVKNAPETKYADDYTLAWGRGLYAKR